MKNKLNKREKIKREFDSILPTLKATFMFLSSHSCPHLAQLSSGLPNGFGLMQFESKLSDLWLKYCPKVNSTPV